MSTTPVKVAVTGAAGQIGYSLLFRIASGSLLGPDTPVELRLLEITPALKALEGVVMELDDCAFPTLAKVEIGDDAKTIFDGVNLALLVGARPRTKGMERGDLLEANGAHLHRAGQGAQRGRGRRHPHHGDRQPGQHQRADRDEQRSRHPRRAVLRADPAGPQPRPCRSWPKKAGVTVTEIKKMTIWGNHSATQYPDLFHAEVAGQNAAEAVGDQAWLETRSSRPCQARRGDHRGPGRVVRRLRRARHRRPRPRLAAGTPDGDWVSMAVGSDGSYGVPEGLISSFPVTIKDGNW